MCLAVIWALLLLRLYLEGPQFNIRADHDALRGTLDMTDANDKLARWRLHLLEFDFEIVHRARTKHQAVRVLCRLHTTGKDEQPLENYVSVLTRAAVQYGNDET